MLCQKTSVQKILFHVNLGPRRFWVEKMLGQKSVGSTKFLSGKKMSNNFLVQNAYLVFQTPSRLLQDTLLTPFRHPPDTLQIPLRHLPHLTDTFQNLPDTLTTSRHLSDNFKIPSRHPQIYRGFPSGIC